MSEDLKAIKQALIGQVQSQMGNLECVNAKELGEVVDMIKDLAETAYYCAVTESMEKLDDKEEMPMRNNYYYTEYPYYPPYEGEYGRERDWRRGKMYYGDGSSSSSTGGMNSGSTSGNSRYYTEYDYPIPIHDRREGRSPMRRKMYMESKEMHQDPMKSKQELESYMQELTSDLMEMIDKASPEEKMMLQNKINTLSNKIANV